MILQNYFFNSDGKFLVDLYCQTKMSVQNIEVDIEEQTQGDEKPKYGWDIVTAAILSFAGLILFILWMTKVSRSPHLLVVSFVCMLLGVGYVLSRIAILGCFKKEEPITDERLKKVAHGVISRAFV